MFLLNIKYYYKNVKILNFFKEGIWNILNNAKPVIVKVKNFIRVFHVYKNVYSCIYKLISLKYDRFGTNNLFRFTWFLFIFPIVSPKLTHRILRLIARSEATNLGLGTLVAPF